MELLRDGTAHARVWAPRRARVEVVYGPDQGRARALERESGGYFAGPVPGLSVGDRYGYRLDGEERLYPDPASRFQPEGPHGPSAVVDAAAFAWSDGGWRGVEARGQVIYELHVGTFTPEGTYAAAARELPALRDLGVTVVELMPLAEFPGRFGWGYDGVDLWAPSHLYGTPDDLRRLVDAAHLCGLGVILDVVYNHLGPDGNQLAAFSADYFTDRYRNEWGGALNFDGEGAAPVRELYVENAAYWIDELHFDGLRLDATQSICDDGSRGEHVLAAIASRARAAGRGRAIFLVAENEPQRAHLVRPVERGGYGLDALWNDDFHHSAGVAATGHDEAYFADYRGTPQELIASVRRGFLYQGQWSGWQKRPRGTPVPDLPATSFVLYLENHDQVANAPGGARLASRTSPGRWRALTALLLLAPGTPMLFQGQELGARRPFLFFADHHGELAAKVARGRRRFLAQFPSLAGQEAQARIDDPAAEATFLRCKLDHRARAAHPEAWALHRDLLHLRREEAAFRQQRADRVEGAVLGPEAFALRFFADEPMGDRLLLVNLGRDLPLAPVPEPLLAPPEGARWALRWCSESVAYGGGGTPATVAPTDGAWSARGGAATVLAPEAAS